MVTAAGDPVEVHFVFVPNENPVQRIADVVAPANRESRKGFEDLLESGERDSSRRRAQVSAVWTRTWQDRADAFDNLIQSSEISRSSALGPRLFQAARRS